MLYIFQQQILAAIKSLNNDADVHGIIVQLPLDCVENIDSEVCTNAVLPAKDVDG